VLDERRRVGSGVLSKAEETMRKRVREHIRSNLVGYGALFLALTGGVAWANHPGGADTISSGDIINGEVKNNDLGADSVGSGKIADQSVKNADLATGASSSNTIADGGIQGIDVKNNTLTGTQINESTLSGIPSANAWNLGGNSGTTAANFLGTTDNRPLNLRVNSARALRLEPASDGTNQSPNVIGGSADNSVAAGVHSATISGGGRSDPAFPAFANRVTDHQGTVGGGAHNQAGDAAGTVADRTWATVGGGVDNLASGARATVAGGSENTASGEAATVAGGFFDTASGSRATVGGGISNTASGHGATVTGGEFNAAIGDWATVDGGFSNGADGDYSFAGGGGARANHNGAFVWADSVDLAFPPFASTAENQFSVRSTGGARFVTEIDLNTGAPTAGVSLAPGGGSWSSLSDAASKRGVEPVSGLEVLRRLESVPISTWSYRSQDKSTRHIGPMAQDFFRAFGVGEDRRHIASVDADGVALAAIKGLSRKLRAERRRRHELEARVAALEQGGR
jgi:hypothetical protein